MYFARQPKFSSLNVHSVTQEQPLSQRLQSWARSTTYNWLEWEDDILDDEERYERPSVFEFIVDTIALTVDTVSNLPQDIRELPEHTLTAAHKLMTRDQTHVNRDFEGWVREAQLQEEQLSDQSDSSATDSSEGTNSDTERDEDSEAE
ncbi:hypothetical protein M231_02968 [Tremella mesenterica]|uniref:Uncharacterized protein n=1 Tax=Tremella mesenterica TaxID=5217 RepID=A0A4Q1BPF0_TREME|nr:hypothetical protein M231_02968 [Tremella mesenterica]